MMANSLRVYFVTHPDGRLTGHLMPRWSAFFLPDPPSAYGPSEEYILDQLEEMTHKLVRWSDDNIDRYFWNETFHTRTVQVEVHPLAAVKKRLVIGRGTIPLRMTYAWSRLERGGFRVHVPRFSWSWILEDLEMAPEVLRQAISTELSGADGDWIFDFRHQGAEHVREWSPRWLTPSERQPADDEESYFDVIHQVAEEWVEQTAKRRLPPVIGEMDWRPHLPWIDRDLPISLLLVGPPGAGKTAWVRSLARLFTLWRRDARREWTPRLWATSSDRISAGMVYLGMWEKRCLDLIDELAYEGDYLYIDHLTGILGEQTGRTSIADLLMPAVASGEISLIAECTEAELEQCRRRAASWVEQFHIIRISPLAPRKMPEMLKAYLSRKKSGLDIHPQGLQRLTSLLATFQRDMAFPGKAFRFIDRLVQEREVKATHTGAKKESRRSLDPNDVIAAFSHQSGLPRDLLSDDHAAGSSVMAAQLARKVVGQDLPCQACARILARFKAGLNDPDKPVGSLFFVGPTGVGKTELAKELSRYLFGGADRLLRYDMSEYMLPGSAERLLAVGPGITSLASELRREPLALVLFDEIEKAHSEVFDLLLGLLGEGRMSDTRGQVVDGRMAVCVMTSNLGVEQGGGLGFGDEANPEHTFVAAVHKHFRPEFFNRLDEVVPFRNLNLEDVERIVSLEMAKVAQRPGLQKRNLRLRVSEAAKARLASWGWHPTRGARPLKRVIEERVMTPIALRLAGDPSLRQRTIWVVAGDDEAASVSGAETIVLESKAVLES